MKYMILINSKRDKFEEHISKTEDVQIIAKLKKISGNYNTHILLIGV